jgi:hypothetical protein
MITAGRRGRHQDGAGGRVEARHRPGRGPIEDDKDVAEITHLMSRAGNWPDGLRWIVRRVKPSRRQMRNLTAYEKATGWRYSITCTNIPETGIAGVPGSHHPQYIDTVHREHAVVETDGVRNGKAMGLRNLPSFIFSPTILRSSDAKIHSGQGFLGMRGPGLHLVPGQEVLARVTV